MNVCFQSVTFRASRMWEELDGLFLIRGFDVLLKICFKTPKNRIHILTVELLPAKGVCKDPITMWLQQKIHR